MTEEKETEEKERDQPKSTKKMKAKVKGRCDGYKNTASATLSLHAGDDLVVKASTIDSTFTEGPSLTGLALSIHKPNSFALHYNLPTKDVGFQFMNTITVMDKLVNLTYTHSHGDHLTAMEGSVAFDPANKVAVGYDFGVGNWKVRYVYAHGPMRTTVVEPCFDVYTNSWDFTLSRRFEGGDSARAVYCTQTKELGLEWKKRSNVNGSFKISASLNLADQYRVPKLRAESTWNYEI